MSQTNDMPDKHSLAPSEIRDAVKVVLSSNEFSGAIRLQDFLAYIVDESLAGRGDQIQGKAIAEHVYKRPPTEGGSEQSVVRVDAGRLRMRLDVYYSGSGRSDRIKIDIPHGGYAPQFQFRELAGHQSAVKSTERKPSQVKIGLVVGGFVLAAAAITYFQMAKPVDEQSDTGSLSAIEREALFDKSPTALQAVDYAQLARELMFPPADPERLRLAIKMFERAIELDDHYSGAYAGAAQALALGALVSNGPAESRKQLLDRATLLANHAQQIDPTSGWVQSALAWVALVSGKHDQAYEQSSRSIKIDPDDPYIRDFHAMIATFSGDFDGAAKIVEPYLNDTALLQRTVHLNVHGVASFHLKNYENAINSLTKITQIGGASSANPLTTAYLAAAFQAAGNQDRAQDLIASLLEAWPDYRIDILLRRIHRNPLHSDDVLALLHAAGLPPSGKAAMSR